MKHLFLFALFIALPALACESGLGGTPSSPSAADRYLQLVIGSVERRVAGAKELDWLIAQKTPPSTIWNAAPMLQTIFGQDGFARLAAQIPVEQWPALVERIGVIRKALDTQQASVTQAKADTELVCFPQPQDIVLGNAEKFTNSFQSTKGEFFLTSLRYNFATHIYDLSLNSKFTLPGLQADMGESDFFETATGAVLFAMTEHTDLTIVNARTGKRLGEIDVRDAGASESRAYGPKIFAGKNGLEVAFFRRTGGPLDPKAELSLVSVNLSTRETFEHRLPAGRYELTRTESGAVYLHGMGLGNEDGLPLLVYDVKERKPIAEIKNRQWKNLAMGTNLVEEQGVLRLIFDSGMALYDIDLESGDQRELMYRHGIPNLTLFSGKSGETWVAGLPNAQVVLQPIGDRSRRISLSTDAYVTRLEVVKAKGRQFVVAWLQESTEVTEIFIYDIERGTTHRLPCAGLNTEGHSTYASPHNGEIYTVMYVRPSRERKLIHLFAPEP